MVLRNVVISSSASEGSPYPIMVLLNVVISSASERSPYPIMVLLNVVISIASEGSPYPIMVLRNIVISSRYKNMHTKQYDIIWKSQILSYLQRPVTTSGDPSLALGMTALLRSIRVKKWRFETPVIIL